MTNPFTIDLRALAVLRICVGLLIVADLLIRWPDVAWFMSDDGVYPAAASKLAASEWRLSLYWLSHSIWWVHFLFAVNVVVALMLVIGMRTRIVGLLAFFLLLSLHNRNPILLQGGDNLLLLLSLWGLFLPWGSRFSIDAVMTGMPPTENRYFSLSTVALITQVLSVYFFSAFLKTGAEWTTDGSAIYYALHNDQVAHGLAAYWRDWHWLTVPLTHYVWWLELLGPVIALSPWFNPWARGAAALGFFTLEIGFLFNLNVGLFPFISMSSLIILMPSVFWDWLARFFSPKETLPMVMYYDQPCTFCFKTCVLLRAIFALNARIEPAQNSSDIGALLEREFSWVLERDGRRYLRWSALVVAIENGGRFRSVATLLVWLAPVGDRIYHWIGVNRGGFGRLTQCLMPWRAVWWRPAKSSQVIAMLLAIAILSANVSKLPSGALQALPSPLVLSLRRLNEFTAPIRDVLRTDQLWNMFAPYPQKNDGWFLMVGLTTDGDLVDVLHSSLSQPTAEKPEYFIPDQVKNYRWRKYFSRIKRQGFRDELNRFASASCAEWNDVDRANRLADWPTLEAFNIYYLSEYTPPMGEHFEIKYDLLWRHHCLDASRLSEEAVKNAMITVGGNNL